MTTALSGPDGRVSAVRAHFGLSQQALATLLGTTQPRLHAAEAGTRDLPYRADLRLRPLLQLLTALPVIAPAATADVLADPAPAVARQQACLAAATRLRYQLDHLLPARAAWARARLAATTSLPTALATSDATEPLLPHRRAAQTAQWALLLTLAELELAQRSGPGPTLLLRARLAGLLAEAEVLSQALEG